MFNGNKPDKNIRENEKMAAKKKNKKTFSDRENWILGEKILKETSLVVILFIFNLNFFLAVEEEKNTS